MKTLSVAEQALWILVGVVDKFDLRISDTWDWIIGYLPVTQFILENPTNLHKYVDKIKEISQ